MVEAHSETAFTSSSPLDRFHEAPFLKEVLSDLALALNIGVPVFLLGPSGIGKSALIRQAVRRLGSHYRVASIEAGPGLTPARAADICRQNFGTELGRTSASSSNGPVREAQWPMPNLLIIERAEAISRPVLEQLLAASNGPRGVTPSHHILLAADGAFAPVIEAGGLRNKWGDAVVLRLFPWPDDEVARFIRHEIPGALSDPTMAEIIRKAAGNPRRILELLHAPYHEPEPRPGDPSTEVPPANDTGRQQSHVARIDIGGSAIILPLKTAARRPPRHAAGTLPVAEPPPAGKRVRSFAVMAVVVAAMGPLVVWESKQPFGTMARDAVTLEARPSAAAAIAPAPPIQAALTEIAMVEETPAGRGSALPPDVRVSIAENAVEPAPVPAPSIVDPPSKPEPSPPATPAVDAALPAPETIALPVQTTPVQTTPVQTMPVAAAPPDPASQSPAAVAAAADLHARPEPVSPPPVPRPAAPQLPINDAFERGNVYLRSGDFASARLLYLDAARAGSVQATVAVAWTYDPEVLARMGVIGSHGDPVKAAEWYRKAMALGDSSAAEPLHRLTGQ